MFDKIFKGHMITGIAYNLLLKETITAIHPINQSFELKGDRFKSDAISFFWGIGFDVKINNSFYFSADGLLKGYYFFSTAVNDQGWKFNGIPATTAGVFVWLNKR